MGIRYREMYPVGRRSRCWRAHCRQPYRSLHQFGVADEGADVDRRDPYGRTPLIVAAAQGNVPLVRRLLALGANAKLVDKSGATALYAAVNRWHGPLNMKVVRLLVCRGADIAAATYFIEQDALLYAIVDKEHRLVRYLLRRGHKPVDTAAANRALSDAWAHGNSTVTTDIVLSHFLNFTDPSVFGEMNDRDNPDLVRRMIRKGADVNRAHNRETPLMTAARAGSLACALILLEAGANPNFRDSDGRLAIDYARASLATDSWLPDEDLEQLQQLINLLHGWQGNDRA